MEKVFHSRPGVAGPKQGAAVKREIRPESREGVRVLDVPWNQSSTSPRAKPRWERGTPLRTPHMFPNVIPPSEPGPPSTIYHVPTQPLWLKEPIEEPEPAPIEQPVEQPVPLASIWQRAAGWLLDSTIIGGIGGLAFLLAGTAFGWEALRPQLSLGFDEVLDGLIIGRSLWVFCLALMVTIAFSYTVLCHSLMGFTPGQRLLGLRLETRDGDQPGMSDCAWRAGIALVTMALGGLSAVWAIVDPQGLPLHDRLVGTRVIRQLSPSEPAAVDVDVTPEAPANQ